MTKSAGERNRSDPVKARRSRSVWNDPSTMTTPIPSAISSSASAAAASRAAVHRAAFPWGSPAAWGCASYNSSRSTTWVPTPPRRSSAATPRATELLPLAIGPLITMSTGPLSATANPPVGRHRSPFLRWMSRRDDRHRKSQRRERSPAKRLRRESPTELWLGGDENRSELAATGIRRAGEMIARRI